MLEVGNGLSDIENKAHFSLWCMLAAPLMAGNDLRNMSTETKEILTNKDAIAINQDALGVQCFKLLDEGDFEVYAKPLDKGELAICFLNRGENLKKISFNWKNYSFTDGLCAKTYDFGKTKYSIRNCWQKVANENTDKAFLAELQAHDVVLLRLIPENN
jgi:alpha-galactosidase